jgi:hypothetical protein
MGLKMVRYIFIYTYHWISHVAAAAIDSPCLAMVGSLTTDTARNRHMYTIDKWFMAHILWFG